MGKSLKGKELGNGIYQRKDGRYYARRPKEDGKLEGKYFWSLGEAREWLGSIYYDKSKKKKRQVLVTTYDDWVDEYFEKIARVQLKESTSHNYWNYYKAYIRDYLGDKDIRQIKPMDLQEVLNQAVAKGLANKSINIIKSFLRKTFSSAADNGLILRSPMTSNVFVKVEPRKNPENYLSFDEQKRFESVLHESSSGDAFGLILQTGLRIGELMALRWEDVDFKERYIHVQHTMNYLGKSPYNYVITSPKTIKSDRFIPMTDKAYDILKELYAHKRTAKNPYFDGIIFLSEEGLPYSESNYRCRLSVIRNKVRYEHCSIHGLRHTFATRCVESGMEIKTLQLIMGHESSTTTMDYYVHVDKPTLTSGIMNLEKYMNEPHEKIRNFG